MPPGSPTFSSRDGRFQLILVATPPQYITNLVRILPPPRVWIVARPGHARSQCIRRLARLEKRLDLGGATRNTTPQAPCTELHGRYRTPKQLARNAKNPGKTWVLQRRGQEPNFWVFSQYFLRFERLICVENYGKTQFEI